MGLTVAACESLKQTARTFHGADRGRLMGRTVEAFGLSQRQAEILLGWSRDTVRKAQHEARAGVLRDVTDLAKEHIQADPTSRTTGLYRRVSAREVREQLVERKGYARGGLPCVQAVGEEPDRLGSRLRCVVKSRPQKG